MYRLRLKRGQITFNKFSTKRYNKFKVLTINPEFD